MKPNWNDAPEWANYLTHAKLELGDCLVAGFKVRIFYGKFQACYEVQNCRDGQKTYFPTLGETKKYINRMHRNDKT